MCLRLPAVVLATFAACATPVVLGAGEVRGRVLLDGTPAAGVAVSLLPFEDGFAAAQRESRRTDSPKALASAVSAKDGTFWVAVPASVLGPGADAVVRLGLAGAGAAPFLLERLIAGAGEDVGDVRLSRAAALAGRVVDERGGPMVGASVVLWAGRGRGQDDLSAVEAVPQTATTKADGSFRFETAGAEGNRLRFETAGFATQELVGARSGALVRPITMRPGRVVRGRVTQSEERAPATAAVVRFEGRTSTRWTETQRDGSFVLDSVPLEPGALVADAGNRGRASLPLSSDAAAPVVIVLAATASLRGRVVDAESARPLAGIRLVAKGEGSVFLGRSGADGRYEIRGLSPQRYRLSADDERHVPWSRTVTVTAGQTEDVDVPLVRGATLAGRVVSEEGAPVEGATLSLVRSAEHPVRALLRRIEGGDAAAIRSGRDGGFRATRLPPGANQRLQALHPEFEERVVGGIDLAAGGTLSGLTVVLRRGLSVRGVVRDEHARPLAGVEVELSRPLQLRGGRGQMQFSIIGPGSRPRRETGADGRFEFSGLKPGDYTLGATRRGLVRAIVDPVKVVEGGPGEPIEITLRPGVTISGFVRDKTGSAASGWSLSARPSGEGGPAFGPAALRTAEPTGPDGFFLLEGLSEGASYDLQLLGSSGLGPRRAGVVAPAEGLELTVGASGQIRGQVVDAESGRPLTDFQVGYSPDGAGGGMRVVFRGPGSRGGRGPDEQHSVHAEDGAFVLDEVPAGKWTVQASAPGYQRGSAAGVAVEEGGTTEGVEVRLSKGGVIAGRVVESRSGRPVLDANVRAELASASRATFRLGGAPQNEAATDADGRFEIAGLAPGSWTLNVSHPDWSEATASVELREAAATAEIRLGRGGSIGGTVTAAGRPVPGAQVALAPAGEAGRDPFGGEQGAISDAGGRFRFDRLQPGRYTVSATLGSQSSAAVDAVLTGEDSQDVLVVLAEGALVRGAVSGLPERSRGGVNVSASGPDQFFATTRTDGDGAFELAGVPEGVIRLSANAGDFLTGSRSAGTTITIAPGQTEAAAEIVFEQGYRVDGHVTRGGRPVAEAIVWAMPEGSGRRSATAQTDDSGAFVLEGLQDGEYTFAATGSRMGAASMPVRRKVTIGGDTTVELEAPPARIAGVVLEAGSARPLGDVSVRIDDEGEGMRFMGGATTDSAGRFSFEDLDPREYRLSFQKAAYEAETRSALAAEESEVRVELRRGEGVVLVARDGVFATPLRGLMVRVGDASGQAVFMGSVPLDSEGRGEVPALPPGSYELRAESSEYAPVTRTVSVPSSELALDLTPGGALEIQVGPQTQALPQAAGRLLGADGRVYHPSVFSSDGRIRLDVPLRRLEHVAPGAYVFEVQGGVRRELTIREGGRTAIALP